MSVITYLSLDLYKAVPMKEAPDGFKLNNL